MRTKIPPEAFAAYLALGQSRSYEAIAKKYRVTKRAVTNLAKKESWSMRLEAAEREGRARAEEKALETLEEMNSRHLKEMQLVQKKAIETLREMSLDSAINAVRALTLAVDRERLIRGEPTERSAVSVEEIFRRELDRVMVPTEQGEE